MNKLTGIPAALDRLATREKTALDKAQMIVQAIADRDSGSALGNPPAPSGLDPQARATEPPAPPHLSAVEKAQMLSTTPTPETSPAPSGTDSTTVTDEPTN